MDSRASFKCLPNRILLAILCKVSAKALCRFRRTCSFMDSFVEMNKRKIASGPNYKGRLSVFQTPLNYPNGVTLIISITNKQRKEVARIPVGPFLTELQRKTSAVSFNQLHIDFQEILGEGIFHRLIDVIKLHHMCRQAFIQHNSFVRLVEVVDLIEAVEAINVSARRSDDVPTFLMNLQKTKNCLKLNVNYHFHEIPLMDNSKHFRSVSITHVPNETAFLHQFLEIFFARDHGGLSKLQLSVIGKRESFLKKFPKDIGAKTVWNINLIPKGRRYWFMPNYIHQIECKYNCKTMYVVENSSINFTTNPEMIFHFKEQEKLFDTLFMHIMHYDDEKLDKKLQKKFLAATVEQKAKILERICFSYKYGHKRFF